LDATIAGTGAAERLRVAVVWGLLEYIGADRPLARRLHYRREDVSMRIAYDQPFVAQAGPVEIKLSEIKLPYEEGLLCYRACRNRALCPCVESPAVALGSVVVAEDRDMSGSLSRDEVVAVMRGHAGAVLAFSQLSYGHLPVMPPYAFFSGLFGRDRGIAAGVCPYSLVDDGAQSDLALVTDSLMRFPLMICASSAKDCVPQVPRL
jgi:hypothetical protein